ncbi:MAG: PTS transporter subunit EIIA [Candidatus Cloacimonetes bacterium]|nr:PTS transporter subunit EIIA [Candidatus Cloacimonadota bacterium]
MYLDSFLDARDICVNPDIQNKEQAYSMLVDLICRNHKLPICGEDLLQRLLQRDAEAPTAYPSGIAIPHIRMDDFDDILVAIMFLPQPLMFGETKVSWVVLIITDKTSSKIYLNLVAALMALSKDTASVQALTTAEDAHAAFSIIKKLGISIKIDLYVADIMCINTVTIPPEATLRELIRVMGMHSLAGLPVVDEAGMFVGEVNILSLLKVGIPEYLTRMDNLDFLVSFEPLERLLEQQDELQVKDIMTLQPIILKPETSIMEAVSEMIKHDKRSMSVVKDNRLMGVVTAKDIFHKVIQA